MARGLTVAVAGATGGLSGLLFGVAKQVVFEDSGLVPGCPLPPLLESDSWTVDLPSVCLGLCIGLLIGPLLDLGFLTGCTFCVRRVV